MDLIKSIFKGDKVIWIIFLFLCLISIIEVFSAASTLTYKSGDHWDPIAKHCIFLLIGTAILILIHNLSYKWFKAIPFFMLPISGIFLLMLLLFDDLNIGGIFIIEKINEAGRWIKICGITFQPSEFAKMGVIIVTANILSRGQTEEEAAPNAFKQIMIIAGITCAMILPENYSTAVLLFGVVYIMMFIGRVSTKKLLILGGILLTAACIFVTFLVSTPNDTLKKIPLGGRLTTWKTRIIEFTSSEHVPAAKFDIDGDAQKGHARIAVATSHIIGKGPGNSVQRDFLSQAFSDFIFAIIIEELGLIGGAVVVVLYLWLLIRTGKIMKKCDRSFPAFLIMGITLLLVTQALFNMMVAVGLAPITGQPLPLISRGGTSTFINCAYIGMILSVSRYTSELEEMEKQQESLPQNVMSNPNAPVASDIQTRFEPTVQILNNDEKFE